MDRDATVARLVELKEEYGVGSSEAYTVILRDRSQERIAEKAARLSNLTMVPTGSFTGKVCADTHEIVRYFLLTLEYRFKKIGWIPRDHYFESSDHFSDETFYTEIDYPAAVGFVCLQLNSPFEERTDVVLRKAVVNVVLGSKIFRVHGHEEPMNWEGLNHWFFSRPHLFHLPYDDDYEFALRHHVELLNPVIDYKLSETAPLAELLISYNEQHRSMFDKMVAKAEEIVNEVFPGINPSLREIYSAESLYDRAERELTLDHLWVRRQIALATVVEATNCRSFAITAEILGEILGGIKSRIEDARERREIFLQQGDLPSLVSESERQIRRLQYESQVILENARWLLRTLQS